MKRKVILVSLSFAMLAAMAAPVFASSGTIDSVNRYAWSENAGWIDFGASQGDVQVTDSGLTGYAWGEDIGWISLNCSNDGSCGTVSYGVSNDGNGNLSGYAWSENAGWINFAPSGGGVTINSSGVFSGYAWGENVGWIVFNCTTTSSCGVVNYEVSTDWRPAASTPAPSSPGPSVQVPASYGSPGFVGPTAPPVVSAPSPTAPTVPPPTVAPSATTAPTSSLAARLLLLYQELNALQTVAASPFSRNLSFGMTGSDVTALQEFLIAEASGPAAVKLKLHGTTKTFGNLTFAALVEFQKTKGITPASGYFGSITRGVAILAGGGKDW